MSYISIGSKVLLSEYTSKLEETRELDKHLIIGEEYLVTTKVISDEHTEVYLEGFPGIAFNLDFFVSA